jgi:hypothetical protein
VKVRPARPGLAAAAPSLHKRAIARDGQHLDVEQPGVIGDEVLGCPLKSGGDDESVRNDAGADASSAPPSGQDARGNVNGPVVRLAHPPRRARVVSPGTPQPGLRTAGGVHWLNGGTRPGAAVEPAHGVEPAGPARGVADALPRLGRTGQRSSGAGVLRLNGAARFASACAHREVRRRPQRRECIAPGAHVRQSRRIFGGDVCRGVCLDAGRGARAARCRYERQSEGLKGRSVHALRVSQDGSTPLGQAAAKAALLGAWESAA